MRTRVRRAGRFPEAGSAAGRSPSRAPGLEGRERLQQASPRRCLKKVAELSTSREDGLPVRSRPQPFLLPLHGGWEGLGVVTGQLEGAGWALWISCLFWC